MSRISLSRIMLLAAFCAPEIADVITTNRTLDNGGWVANPFREWTMTHFGIYWPIPKLTLMALCVALMFRWKPTTVAPFVALMCIVVANNALWAFS